jgi:hypothetical protein
MVPLIVLLRLEANHSSYINLQESSMMMMSKEIICARRDDILSSNM